MYKVTDFNYYYRYKFLIHIQVKKGVEIMYNFCCFPVDPVLNSPECQNIVGCVLVPLRIW